jgi:outer membrane protein assembly factor BamB
MFAAIWGSTIFIDGRIYIGDEDGDITVLRHGPKLEVLAETNMNSSVYSTPVPANGVLYVSTRNQLFALADGASTPPAATK